MLLGVQVRFVGGQVTVPDEFVECPGDQEDGEAAQPKPRDAPPGGNFAVSATLAKVARGA